jgi:hypothetical protein
MGRITRKIEKKIKNLFVKIITMVHMVNSQSMQQQQRDHIHMDYDDAMDFH